MTKQIHFSLINLWCTKNLVDSQYFLGRLFDMSLKTPEIQIKYFTDPFDKEAKIVFLNTCGFISSARDEADETVKNLLQAGKTIYLMGCAVQYYKKLVSSFSSSQDSLLENKHWSSTSLKKMENKRSTENIHYLSRGDMNTINLKQILQWYDSKIFWDFEFASSPRVYTNLEQKFEYLKISEWCDNHCTFCIIPEIRGKQQSLPMAKILNEAKQMIANGVQEIILIAQDTTRYGSDLYDEPKLLELLNRLDKLKWDFTYRLLYLYPDVVTLNQVKELKTLKKFIPYFDIPLQHISSSVLKKMGRFYDEIYIQKFIDQIKKSFPVRFIRTNLIIGFPGETKQDFDKLVKFVEDTKFDNIALFEYHDEPLAASSKLPDKVDDNEIRARFTKIKKIVEHLLSAKSKVRKGKQEIGYIMEIWQDGKIKKLTVRPRLHAPEIDSYDEILLEQVTEIFDEKNELEIGDQIMYIV